MTIPESLWESDYNKGSWAAFLLEGLLKRGQCLGKGNEPLCISPGSSGESRLRWKSSPGLQVGLSVVCVGVAE